MNDMPDFKWVAFLDNNIITGQDLEGLPAFWIVSLNFWMRNKMLQDKYILEDLTEELQETVVLEERPGHCLFPGSIDETIALLVKNGIFYGGIME